MTKQKTKKLLTKRINVTKNGKVLRRKAFSRHLNTKKGNKVKRRLGRVVEATPIWSKRIKKFLGL